MGPRGDACSGTESERSAEPERSPDPGTESERSAEREQNPNSGSESERSVGSRSAARKKRRILQATGFTSEIICFFPKRVATLGVSARKGN